LIFQIREGRREGRRDVPVVCSTSFIDEDSVLPVMLMTFTFTHLREGGREGGREGWKEGRTCRLLHLLH
jgi:hypothetical protein